MKILLTIVFVKSLNLLIFIWFNRAAGLRILALRQQINIYRRKVKKPHQVKSKQHNLWVVLFSQGDHRLSRSDRRPFNPMAREGK